MVCGFLFASVSTLFVDLDGGWSTNFLVASVIMLVTATIGISYGVPEMLHDQYSSIIPVRPFKNQRQGFKV